LNIVELRAIALVRCSRLTISRTNDWRAGASKAFTIPKRKASTRMCHGATTRANTSADSAKASSMLNPWVTTRMLRRLTRSARTPPNSVNSHEATPPAKPVYPSQADERVSSNTR
jgi:hypothetical protein